MQAKWYFWILEIYPSLPLPLDFLSLLLFDFSSILYFLHFWILDFIIDNCIPWNTYLTLTISSSDSWLLKANLVWAILTFPALNKTRGDLKSLDISVRHIQAKEHGEVGFK